MPRLLDYGARSYDPLTCSWTTPDPLAHKYLSWSPYSFTAANPVNFVDPDGQFPETIWDIANASMDVYSFISNILEKNYGAATVDGIALTADVLAALIPFVPGGAGTIVRALRGGDHTLDVCKASKNASSVTRKTLRQSAEIGQEAHRQIERELMQTGLADDVECTIILNNSIRVRKDAHLVNDSYLVIKPDTPSGHSAAIKRQALMEKYGYSTSIFYYNPQNPAYLPGSSSYIGPKRK